MKLRKLSALIISAVTAVSVFSAIPAYAELTA